MLRKTSTFFSFINSVKISQLKYVLEHRILKQCTYVAMILSTIHEQEALWMCHKYMNKRPSSG